MSAIASVNAQGFNSLNANASSNAPSKQAQQAPLELDEQERRQVQELSSRDREVRAHEQAHLAAAGGLARGGPSYSTQQGPDGQRYAVGGEVQIDTSPVKGDPQATLQKAEQIQRAAMAPASPSAQDRSVAAAAASMAAKARVELQQQDETQAATDPKSEATGAGDSTQAPQAKHCPTCGSLHKFEDVASAQRSASAQAYAASAATSVRQAGSPSLQLTA